MAKYTIHNIPKALYPLWMIYTAIVFVYFILQNLLFRSLCTIEYAQKEHVESVPNHIFSLWHENIGLFFTTHHSFKKPNIWMTFPIWYMKPSHLLLKWFGCKELAYGGSGADGKKALKEVIEGLKKGYSTFINPDGPFGPIRECKNGVLLMSLKTGVPIIPVSFQLEKEWRIPSWDRKRYPRFFRKVVVVYRAPIYVTEENFEEARKEVSEGMDDFSTIVKSDSKGPSL